MDICIKDMGKCTPDGKKLCVDFSLVQKHTHAIDKSMKRKEEEFEKIVEDFKKNDAKVPKIH